MRVKPLAFSVDADILTALGHGEYASLVRNETIGSRVGMGGRLAVVADSVCHYYFTSCHDRHYAKRTYTRQYARGST